MSTPFAVTPLDRPPSAEITVPGSKSHTNRALICAGLADGESVLNGALIAQDTEAMVGALRSLGRTVDIATDHDTPDGLPVMTVRADGARFPPGPLQVDVAQSGTTSRFLLAVLALGSGPYVLDGDPQLRARPFGPLAESLRGLGVRIDNDRLPITVSGPLHAGHATISGSVSSQFLSGLLLAAPLAKATESAAVTTISVADELVSAPYVALTIDTMAAFGVDVGVDGGDGTFTVLPQPYAPRTLAIEPDASAASYFFAAAAITGGRVRVPRLGTGTVQGDLAFVDALERMGATVTRRAEWTEVVGGSPLRGIDIDMTHISDTAQTLAVVASQADSPTRVRGIGFIRYKETDRLAAVVAELNRLGVGATETEDGFIVEPATVKPGVVETYDDHRMAMSFALLGLAHPGVEIADPDCVAKTFPGFFSVLDELRR